MKISIRKAHEDELKSIQDLNHKLFLWDYDRDPTLNINWPYEKAGEEYFRKKISGESGVCFVAVAGSGVVGYLAGYMFEKIAAYDTVKRSELDNIFVEEEFRGQGVGKLLVEEFLAWSKFNGATSTVVSAYSLNERAIEFYERVGFKPLVLKLETKL
jgi:ribosomal protein S18 acetylase RimI-like enzyme